MFTTPFTFLKAVSAGGDADATAYLAAVVAAGGTVDATITSATDTLFVDMKTAGVYAKMVAFWPIVGSVAGSHAINANLDSTYNLTYNGSWTHSSAGQTPSVSNGWANTGWTFPLNSFDNSFGVYVSYKATSGAYAIDMSTSDGTIYFMVSIFWNETSQSRYWNQDKDYFGTSPDGGLMINTRTSSSNWRTYINGALEQTTTSTATGNGVVPNLILGAGNYTGGPQLFSGRRQVFAFIGQGLSNTEALDFATAINTFETALGRNAY
jgi:hypothetical protein